MIYDSIIGTKGIAASTFSVQSLGTEIIKIPASYKPRVMELFANCDLFSGNGRVRVEVRRDFADYIIKDTAYNLLPEAGNYYPLILNRTARQVYSPSNRTNATANGIYHLPPGENFVIVGFNQNTSVARTVQVVARFADTVAELGEGGRTISVDNTANGSEVSGFSFYADGHTTFEFMPDPYDGTTSPHLMGGATGGFGIALWESLFEQSPSGGSSRVRRPVALAQSYVTDIGSGTKPALPPYIRVTPPPGIYTVQYVWTNKVGTGAQSWSGLLSSTFSGGASGAPPYLLIRKHRSLARKVDIAQGGYHDTEGTSSGNRVFVWGAWVNGQVSNRMFFQRGTATLSVSTLAKLWVMPTGINNWISLSNKTVGATGSAAMCHTENGILSGSMSAFENPILLAPGLMQDTYNCTSGFNPATGWHESVGQ